MTISKKLTGRVLWDVYVDATGQSGGLYYMPPEIRKWLTPLKDQIKPGHTVQLTVGYGASILWGKPWCLLLERMGLEWTEDVEITVEIFDVLTDKHVIICGTDKDGRRYYIILFSSIAFRRQQDSFCDYLCRADDKLEAQGMELKGEALKNYYAEAFRTWSTANL